MSDPGSGPLLLLLLVAVLGFFLATPFAIFRVAQGKGHNGLNWALASILITPPMAAILVAGLPDRQKKEG